MPVRCVREPRALSLWSCWRRQRLSRGRRQPMRVAKRPGGQPTQGSLTWAINRGRSGPWPGPRPAARTAPSHLPSDAASTWSAAAWRPSTVDRSARMSACWMSTPMTVWPASRSFSRGLAAHAGGRSGDRVDTHERISSPLMGGDITSPLRPQSPNQPGRARSAVSQPDIRHHLAAGNVAERHAVGIRHVTFSA